MAITTIPLAELVEDMAIYPRHAVDGAHVTALAQALRAGAAFPPLVADKKSKRLVDGWHRARAYGRVHGPGALVDVDLRAYKTEEEVLLDAIRLNASHGRRLDRIDQVRCVVLADERSIAQADIARALNITEEHVTKLRVRLAFAPAPSSGTVKVALKRPVHHLEGQALSERQVRAIESAPGTSYLLIVRQLHDALREGLIDLGDERMITALRALAHELDGILAAA